MSILCGSLDRLAHAFVELDCHEREDRLNAVQEELQYDNVATGLKITSASLSPADRRVVRTDEMDQRVEAAASSRAPRYRR